MCLNTLAAILFAGLALVGCHTPTVVVDALRPSSLPKDEGIYGGSFIWHRWTYAGTDQLGHHVRYRFNRANVISYRDYIFREQCFGFQFDLQPPRRDLADLFPINPLMQTDAIIGFRREESLVTPTSQDDFKKLSLPNGVYSLTDLLMKRRDDGTPATH
jgi:hypothetical protein